MPFTPEERERILALALAIETAICCRVKLFITSMETSKIMIRQT
jgi:hypothetical protein